MLNWCFPAQCIPGFSQCTFQSILRALCPLLLFLVSHRVVSDLVNWQYFYVGLSVNYYHGFILAVIMVFTADTRLEYNDLSCCTATTSRPTLCLTVFSSSFSSLQRMRFVESILESNQLKGSTYNNQQFIFLISVLF